jgi:hypothetical protein
MSFGLRTTILAAGCILAVGNSAAEAQTRPAYYYPAPGVYATTTGTVNIPAAGIYYNVPLYVVPAPASPSPSQWFTYSNSSFYYPGVGAYTGGGDRANLRRSEPSRVSAYVSGDEEDDPDW